MVDEQESFGQRMARIKGERGQSRGGPGRKPIRDRYQRQIAAVERVFADGIAGIAAEYLDTLHEADPETCTQHQLALCCPECGHPSERTSFNHKAAAYAFDRIMGRPTTRTEQTIAGRVVKELASAFIAAFLAVNDLDERLPRQQAFARRCGEISAQYGGDAA